MIKCSECRWLVACGCNGKIKPYCNRMKSTIEYPTMCGCSFAQEIDYESGKITHR